VAAMSAKENKALLRRLIGELNKGEAAAMPAIEETCSPAFVQHNAYGEEVEGLENYKRRVADLLRAIPDAHFAIDDILAEGDDVASRFTMTGTHTGNLQHVVDLSATGRKVTAQYVAIYRIKDGKFVEGWERFDTLGVMRQLGFDITPPKTTTSVEEVKALMRHWIDESNKGNAAALAVIDEICAPNIIVHGIAESTGLENYKRFVGEAHSAFPDICLTLHDMVVEGDKIAIRFTETGTHKGAFMGIPPTNKKVTIRGVEIDRIVGGKVVEIWSGLDVLGLMQQLGLVLKPGSVGP